MQDREPEFLWYESDKRLMMNITLNILLIAFLSCLSVYAQSSKRIVGYVTSWSDEIPDPKSMTNINYAFGHVTESFDSVRIDNLPRLQEIVALKDGNPSLEVMLSVGGWGSGGFSEMASDALKRKAFAQACRYVVDAYGLDGIDIDWEYPGSDAAGISCSKDDKANYTLLMCDLRQALGNDKLLTIASPATVGFYEFGEIMPYVDFVNVMAYDLNRPPYHHAALYRSKLSGSITADEGIRAHISGGVPPEKLILGVSFYGHGKKGIFPDFVDFAEVKPGKKMRVEYDRIACVPYIVDKNGAMVMTFENERSIARKCRYVIDNNLGGIMFWDYGGDAPGHDLLNAIHSHLK